MDQRLLEPCAWVDTGVIEDEKGGHALVQPLGRAELSPVSPPHSSSPASGETERLRALAYELTLAETRERERVAHGLHDDVGQALALVSLKLDELRQEVGGLPCASLVEELNSLVVQAARATRSATFDLSCPVLQQLGLTAALESLGQRTQRQYGLLVQVSVDAHLPKLEPAVDSVVFRVVRELLINAAKHARAGTAWVDARFDGASLTLSVRDDGIGCDMAMQRPGFSAEGGFGLHSARAQLQAIGAELSIESAPGHGTRATLSFTTRPSQLC
jgi:signal transduction histidine kinase